jgi:hypothetical protein
MSLVSSFDPDAPETAPNVVEMPRRPKRLPRLSKPAAAAKTMRVTAQEMARVENPHELVDCIGDLAAMMAWGRVALRRAMNAAAEGERT